MPMKWRFMDNPNLELLNTAGISEENVPLEKMLQGMPGALETGRKARAALAGATTAHPDARGWLDAQVSHAQSAAARARDEARRDRDRRRKISEERAAEAATRLRTRPDGADPDDDRAEQARWVEYGRKLDPAERDLMARNAAKAGTHRPMLRAWLTEPTGPWTSVTVEPMLRADTVQFIDDWTVAHDAPSAVCEEHAAWRLDRLAEQIDLDAYQLNDARLPAPLQFDDRDGIKIARP